MHTHTYIYIYIYKYILVTTQPYLNFDGDYVRHDEDNNIAPAPQPYQKRDEDGNPIVAQPYVRRDENNNPV